MSNENYELLGSRILCTHPFSVSNFTKTGKGSSKDLIIQGDQILHRQKHTMPLLLFFYERIEISTKRVTNARHGNKNKLENLSENYCFLMKRIPSIFNKQHKIQTHSKQCALFM